jgi:DnaJ domain
MGFHAFSLDPRTVLGVGPDASLEELHEAYRAKSKKHHPDRGGDEWAFRMVGRAYEVLKTMAARPAEARRWEGGGAAGPARTNGSGRSSDWSWSWSSRFSQPGAGAQEPDTAEWLAGAGAGAAGAAESGAATVEPAAAPLDPARMRTVDVELIWTRFESDGPARLLSEHDTDDATLSVCMVISWPETGLVDRTAEFPGAAEVLRSLIELFEQLRHQQAVVAARSRIEDGRFVGWLSYPDVLTAQDAVLTVRDTFRTRGLTVKLQTRDERVPFDWHAEVHAPVMSQAS